MAFPVIAHKTILRNTGATIADPGTEIDFDINNIKDLKSYTLWKSNGVTSPINIDIDMGVGNSADADHLLLVNSNFTTVGATIEIFADTFTPPTTSRAAAVAVGTDNVYYRAFTAPGAFRHWRVQIVDPAPPFASAPFTGVLNLGLKTLFTELMIPEFDPFFDDIEAVGSASEGGHHLGTLLRGHIHRGTISFGQAGAPRSVYTSDLNAFIDHAQKKLPFGFVLDTGDSDFAVARYIKVPDEALVGRQAVGGTWARLILTLPVEEAFMEPAT